MCILIGIDRLNNKNEWIDQTLQITHTVFQNNFHFFLFVCFIYTFIKSCKEIINTNDKKAEVICKNIMLLLLLLFSVIALLIISEKQNITYLDLMRTFYLGMIYLIVCPIVIIPDWVIDLYEQRNYLTKRTLFKVFKQIFSLINIFFLFFSIIVIYMFYLTF